MFTFRSLFTGFGGCDIGAKELGLKLLPGIEYDKDIASVAQSNGFEIIVSDILDIDPDSLEYSDILHASPPCPSFSVANQGGEETELDKALGRKVAQFIEVHKPKIFTLENVYQYRNSESWGIIRNALEAGGYMYDFDHVNFANFSVPQTRKRMIVRAIRGALLPPLPPPERWVGWYEAIEDLIPDLPESEFAPWQLERLPEFVKSSGWLIGGVNAGQAWGGDRLGSEPAMTITQGQRPRAFLVDDQNGKPDQNGNRTLAIREQDDPSRTISSSYHPLRGFIVDDQNGSMFASKDKRGLTIRQSYEPVHTISASQDKRPIRSFIIPGDNASNNTIRYDNEPMITVGNVNRVGDRPRSWLSQGRVVSMTPRALARFQSFPDWYKLPDKKGLACKGIGNAVPPLGYQKILKQLVELI